MLWLVMLALSGILSAEGQIVSDGQCSTTLQPMGGFDLEAYLGLWYEISRTPNAFELGQCVTAEYTLNAETGQVDVYNSNVIENFYDSISGTARLESDDGSAALIVSFPSTGFEPTSSNYWVLETDYINFALVYNCQNINANQRSISLWKLSRTTSLTANMHAFLDVIINGIVGMSSTDMITTDNSEDACFLLRVLEEGEAVVLDGQCSPNIPVVQNFDAARYLGLWHDIASYPNEFQYGTCSNARYSLEDGANIVDVINTQVVNQALDTIVGTAVPSSDGTGRLTVAFPNGQGGTTESEYLIVATDYDNYALVYSCVNVNPEEMRVFSWKLSRTKQLSAASSTAIDAATSNIIVLNDRYYLTTDQNDDSCFFYPEPVTGQPVVFSGQCDSTISGVGNFDIPRYMGLWHDIEAYPSVFQGGTCNNAEYQLNAEEGTVDVYNTQVVGERLDSIRGVARPASDDSTGRLVVTFPIAGTDETVEMDYIVLATDYDNYALVYACQNINEDQRTVWSWKLSRSKEMIPAANAAMNTVIETIPVLDQRYYEIKNQSSDGCFYFPYPEAGVPVVFPGACASNVAAVPNFDVARYAGLWHEISSYPSGFQGGSCNNALYTLTEGGTVDVYNTQVLDGFLDAINGEAVLSSTDQSGQLTVTFPIAGTTVTISSPYWVLATDYVTYSLVYSCVNLENDQRAVWSWKLSRTKDMPAAANAPMDAAIDQVQVLEQEYYVDTDQSDEACFYLPDLEPGEPVVIVGQCDLNIPVVQNFDVSRYSGLWHEIESYPSDFQQGTCNNALYTPNLDGSVEVYNTQVVNQLLDSVNGSAVLATSDGSGKLLVSLPIPGTTETAQLEYWILDTDYDNHALVYSCQNIDSENRRVWSWKLSRTKQLTEAAINSMDAVINTVPVLNTRFLQPRDQRDEACFYYPEPNGQPVIFRGQCDASIPAVPNFDPQRYAGRWYDIEKYPSVFQAGTCNDATYTLTPEGTVDVFNTQVVNEQLDTIRGVARLLEGDSSGKLVVSFPIPGTDATTETSYWVLATDYENYSLVYTCENIADDERAVWSWKLSRTRQLSNEANAAINAVINTVPVLDQVYYESTDHSDIGCFYYPEPEPGVPVVFRAQCDLNIPVVQNFDATRYAGLWHEISSYPSVFQGGTCNNARYTLTPEGTVEVFNTQVLDQRLDTITGTATADPSGQAKLTVRFPVAGTNDFVETPYWVLDTDYETYSLVYTCVNLNNEESAVWSWKLSRTKELPEAASAAIDDVVTTVPVLDERYFEMIDQSDDSCFYLPYWQPNDPVLFIGQCDQNIPVVQNFDVNRYQGLWNEIESYYSEFQGGTCNNAEYTINPDGTVDVYNTQVVNQLLDTIRGQAEVLSDGKLLVTFPITGTTETTSTEYWVLDTDYDNYALVYTCVNVDSESRRVWSWKLSRTQDLSVASSNAINAIVDTIPVLNSDYYNAREQSDDSCLYFPEPNGQPVNFRGQCDESIPAVPNFDPERYSGLWYDIEKYPSVFQAGTCNNALYTLAPDGTVEVYNTQVVNEQLDTITGVARLAQGETSGKLEVSFPIAGTDETTQTNYWVLATDYDTYSLVYTCENTAENRRSVWSWKLSRSKQLSAAANEAMTAVINTITVLDPIYFEQTDQTNDGCFYYPEPEPGVPVVFPGQCDLNIPVVQNFDATRYAGLWHEISSYPSVFQGGTCKNARYTLTPEGTVEVFNTQVLDQRLDTITGTATADPSGQAILTVRFPVAGTDEFVETPYWVLDTDYETYSLVYTCVNLNSEERGVWSWKLSRTKEMPAAAITAIEETIDTIPVLDERYFQQGDQSEDSCFYLPDLQPGEPVIFVGQCDLSIPTQADFDPVRYAGLWHEIESYPSVFQEGTCNNAQYTLTAEGTVDVYNTQVVSERLDTISGVARLTDESAKLEVTFPVAGTEQTVTSDYWVLSTDYEDYALVYSCANLDSERRQVWTWKLSRSRQLSAGAQSAINAVVDTIPVLNGEYYLNRDQTDFGCFYFPVHVPGQSVVFPGQCDESVQVVQNFDVVEYSGFWYEVQSYPQPFQVGGSCANALYTLNEDGVVDVYNTQVLAQQLDTINGTARLDSATGEAKLVVTFPIAGTDLFVDAPYWVLATDYTSYSLVYACTNIAEDRRSVTSWKLSRNPDLSADANAEIETAVNTVQVLSGEYYEETVQTEEACFYYPDNFGGPVILDGQCDAEEDVPVVEEFNAAQYLGTWYEAARFPTEFQTGECARAEYTLDQASGTVDVLNTIVSAETLDSEAGQAVVSPSGRGVLSVSFPSSGPASVNYYILDTDYTNFALVYSCRNIDALTKQVYSWKLSRSRQGLSAEANARIDSIVTARVDLFEGYYVPTDQGDDACFYYPEFPGQNSAIVLPGPCNTTIQGVPNFQADLYTGRWFETARYPQEFELGECARAEYTLTPSGVVDVVNTIVYEETLETVVGTAVAMPDGTGQLTVTFPIAGTSETREANYYILDTDYVNYALVYSCRDLESGDRQVSSWKLSRQPTLAPQYDAVLAPTVEVTQGLLEAYYLTTQQTDEACFYFPELDESQSVVYRGQCEEVAGVANFDIERYLGWWHEIEHYPSGFETGACLSSRFEVVGGQYSSLNTSVAGDDATVVRNGITVSADAPGRLRKTLDNGETVDIWVLATDYDTFSLLYSCENIDDEHRRVWSAKHSKARELSAPAQDAMAPVIESNRVLRSNFYLPVDQSDDACFHYPALEAGEQVVLSGQCDTAIPVVNEFELSSFTGLWFETERYPEARASGTCAGARVTLGSEGDASVRWLRVLDDEPQEVEGAVALAADGSGRLTITYPVDDTEDAETRSLELYVLATDYLTYSLIYTCENVNQFQRAVGSWKLSRGREMPAGGTQAIDAVISARPELDQRYFVDAQQSEDCPEPSSASALAGTAALFALLAVSLRILA